MSPLRQLVQLAMRIKANHPWSAAELDKLLAQHGKAETDVVALRTVLLDEGLLQVVTADTYVRLTIGPDHPATAKLRAEALARYSAE